MKKYNYILAMSVNEAIPIIDELKAKGVRDIGHMPYRLGKNDARLDPEVESMYPATPTVIRWSDPPLKIEITSQIYYNDTSDVWEFACNAPISMFADGKIFKITLEELQ